MFPTKVVEKIKTRILLSVIFLNCAVYEVMWKNTVELDRPQVTVWHMCIACWIPKTTNTHSEYVVFIAFRLQKWLKKCASMLRYVYFACLVKV